MRILFSVLMASTFLSVSALANGPRLTGFSDDGDMPAQNATPQMAAPVTQPTANPQLIIAHPEATAPMAAPQAEITAPNPVAATPVASEPQAAEQAASTLPQQSGIQTEILVWPGYDKDQMGVVRQIETVSEPVAQPAEAPVLSSSPTQTAPTSLAPSPVMGEMPAQTAQPVETPAAAAAPAPASPTVPMVFAPSPAMSAPAEATTKPRMGRFDAAPKEPTNFERAIVQPAGEVAKRIWY